MLDEEKLKWWAGEIRLIKTQIATATQGDDAWLKVNLMEVRQNLGELAYRIETNGPTRFGPEAG